MRRSYLCVGAVLVAVSITAGCGVFSDPAKTAAASATVTSSVVSSTRTMASTSASATPSPSATTSKSSTPTATGTGGTILDPTTVTGRDLTIVDAFARDGRWKDDRYNVASLKDAKGMGVLVESCSAPGSSMELRLENGFSQLTFTAGQGNASESSAQILKVEVLGDQRQLDIRQVAFNQTQDLAISVTGVNSLKIFLYLDQSNRGCYNTVEAVLMNMKLS